MATEPSTTETPETKVTPAAKPVTKSDLDEMYDNIIADGKKAISFGLSHLVLIILLFAVSLGAFYEYDSRRADHANAAAKAATAVAQTMAVSNKQFQAQTAEQVQQLAVQNKNLQATISQLASSIVSQNVALAQKTQAVQSLPPTALATQWGSAAAEPAPSIDGNGNFVAPLPLAQKSYTALITVPVLQGEDKNLQQQVSTETQIASNNEKQFQSEEAAHQKDNVACSTEENSLNAQLKSAKLEAKKDKIKRFFEGLLIGGAAVALHAL